MAFQMFVFLLVFFFLLLGLACLWPLSWPHLQPCNGYFSYPCQSVERWRREKLDGSPSVTRLDATTIRRNRNQHNAWWVFEDRADDSTKLLTPHPTRWCVYANSFPRVSTGRKQARQSVTSEKRAFLIKGTDLSSAASLRYSCSLYWLQGPYFVGKVIRMA